MSLLLMVGLSSDDLLGEPDVPRLGRADLSRAISSLVPTSKTLSTLNVSRKLTTSAAAHSTLMFLNVLVGPTVASLHSGYSRVVASDRKRKLGPSP